jgi:hypothetical protein
MGAEPDNSADHSQRDEGLKNIDQRALGLP